MRNRVFNTQQNDSPYFPMVLDNLTFSVLISSTFFHQIAQELLEFRTQNTSYLYASHQEQIIDSQRLYMATHGEAQVL